MFIVAIILFLTSIVMLNFHNRDDTFLPICMMSMFASAISLIEWKRVFTSLQILVLILIWMFSTMSAIVHPILPWAFPGYYKWPVKTVKKGKIGVW